MRTSLSRGSVVAVCRKAEPGLPKLMVDAVELIENYGIAGDYHRAKRRIASVRIANKDKPLKPGMLGENITLDGITPL